MPLPAQSTQTPCGNSIAMDIATALEGDKEAQQDLVNKFKGNEQFMTVMIQSLPWTFQEEDLIREINRVTTPWSFDFFYMPWNTKRDSNCGYAFVNFKAPIFALQCATGLIGRTFGSKSKTIKPCVVVPAHVQGLKNNVEHYRDRVVCSPNNPHCPFIFEDGKKMSFQKAVELMCGRKAPRAPNSRASDPARTERPLRLSETEGLVLQNFVSKHPEWQATFNESYREMTTSNTDVSSSSDEGFNPPQSMQSRSVQASHGRAGYPVAFQGTRMMNPTPPGLFGGDSMPVPLCRDALDAHQDSLYDGYSEIGSQSSHSSFQSCNDSHSETRTSERRRDPNPKRTQVHQGSDRGSSATASTADSRWDEDSGYWSSLHSSSHSGDSSGGSAEEEVVQLSTLDLEVMNRFIEKFS